VRDDGTGFDVSETEATYDSRSSLGLLNMQERAEALGAKYAIESAPGKGTLVYLVVPLGGLTQRDAGSKARDGASASAPGKRRKPKTGPLGWNDGGPPSPTEANERRKGTGPLGILNGQRQGQANSG
jgi:hypothetical protein